MSSQPVWRQAKDMLKEEGIAVADADSIKHLENPAAAQVQVPFRPLAIYIALPPALCCTLLALGQCCSIVTGQRVSLIL